MQRPSSEDQERRFVERLVALRSEQPSLLLGVQDLLLDFERRIALLERCLPLNFKSEVSALEEALLRGEYRSPAFVYAGTATETGKIVRELANFRGALGGLRVSDRFAPALFELVLRAEELQLEAQLASRVGTMISSELIEQRYVIEPEDDLVAARLAEQWLVVREDEPGDPPLVELGSFLRAQARSKGVDVVVHERPIASLAAASSDTLVVLTGALVARSEAERIWVHEVFAHLLPRRRGPHSCAPLAAGTKGAADDEEGRALWLEEKNGLLRANRKRELAVRHVIATSARRDPSQLREVALGLVAQGHNARGVAHAVGRALRGGGRGGLCREAIYLPAFLRVQRCLADHPEADLWMQWGRVSAAAAVQFHHWL